jgi:hypothetical protein
LASAAPEEVPVESAASGTDDAVPETRRAKVRSVFGSLASRRRPARASAGNGSGNGGGNGAIPSLFGDAEVDREHDAAARRLAGAFADEYRDASTDPSQLDALFSDHGREAASSSADVTFDDFFAGGDAPRAADAQRSDAASSEQPSGQSKSDLETFHAWLGGLKQ